MYSKYARKRNNHLLQSSRTYNIKWAQICIPKKESSVQKAIARTRSLKRLSTDVWQRSITHFYPTLARIMMNLGSMERRRTETDGSLNEANRRKRVYRIARPHYRPYSATAIIQRGFYNFPLSPISYLSSVSLFHRGYTVRCNIRGCNDERCTRNGH